MHAFQNAGAFLRDYLFLVFLAGNICIQAFFVFKLFEWRKRLVDQCSNINTHTYGIIASITTMLLLVPFTSICMYSVKQKTWDAFSMIVTAFTWGWLIYAGVGNVFGILTCRKSNYPFIESIILLITNGLLLVFIMFFGSKHGHRGAKDRRLQTTPPQIRVQKHIPIEIPKMNKFLSLERSERHRNNLHNI